MQSINLAVDIQGGDFGARILIEGVLEARKASRVPINAYLCGDEKTIVTILDSFGQTITDNTTDLIIEHCPEVVEPDEVPSRVWKNKKKSSIVRCISLQSEGIADVSLSAGDTRILMGTSIFLLGRRKGVTRPALGAFVPTTASRTTLLLDVGANLDCKVDHLVTFGLMGYDYVKKLFSLERPSVAMLNVGKEATKGTKTIVEAARILDKKCDGFCGFIEGSRVLSGDVDVIVCDGFTGNILLKACESFHILTESVLKGDKRLINKLLKKMEILNAENYGAVQLLGLQGIVYKAHGSSSSKAITQAILASVRAVDQIKYA